MKHFLIILCLAFSIPASSQTCEERESKLLELNGSLSAGFIYNTYAVIGALADGFGHDVYDKESITDLFAAQRKMASNMVEVLQETISKNILKDQEDKDYVRSSVVIVKNFITQIDLFLKYVQNKTQKNLNAFQAERTQNWKQISKLMGIKE